LAKFEPIAPLTGDDSEWIEVDQDAYQNRRMSSVFKQPDRFNGQAYWIEGVIFWEWVSHHDIDRGAPYKSYFMSSESHVPITFPWVKPEPEYRFRPTDEFPHEILSAGKEPDKLISCACGDRYPSQSYGAGFIHAIGYCPNCDAAGKGGE
jgi:hypothetical protein